MNRIARRIGMSFRSSRHYLTVRELYLLVMFQIPAWLLGIARLGPQRRGIAVFTPDTPGRMSSFRTACALNRLAVRPVSDLARADVVIHYSHRDLVAGDAVPGAVNGGWTDQSKSHLDAIHQRVFGYGLTVDPLVHVGSGVVKSERQFVNDGRIVQFPVDAVEPGKVYQRFVDTMTDRGACEEMSVLILGDRIHHVSLEQRPGDERRFIKNQAGAAKRIDIDRALSTAEQAAMVRLARALGIDAGQFDVLRDKDGRIYVVDANPSLSLPLISTDTSVAAYWRTAIDVAVAFRRDVIDHHLRRSTLREAPSDPLRAGMGGGT